MEEVPVSVKPVLFRAKWVFPMRVPPIENGAVLVSGGRIREVGSFRLLKKHFSGKVLDLRDLALLPALSNLHAHLELSVLRYRLTPSGSFTSWVKNLIRKRTEYSVNEAKEAAERALKELWREGVGIVADVGNTGLTIPLLRSSRFFGVYFREVIDFRGNTDIKNFPKAEKNGRISFSLSPHSPYSVSPLLIQAIKSWTRRAGLPFSIHVAESPEEVVFVKEGAGPIRSLLEERGQLHPGFEVPGTSPVAYLERLGVLDEATICVHAVQLEPSDIEIMAKRKVKPCLCPRSNIFLGVGLPPLPALLKAGLKPCIGTDSLASNDRLSVFAEMEALRRAYPQVSPEVILLMGTLWGAEAAGIRDLGGIFPGARPELVGIESEVSEKDPFGSLLDSKKHIRIRIYGDL